MKVIIFDWDDTLFPTSILKFQFPRYNIENIKEYPALMTGMLSLEKNILDTLQKLIEPESQIVIVTNAHRGWVSKGLDIWQELHKFIATHKIEIYYPREDVSLLHTPEDRKKFEKENDYYTLIKLDAFFSVAKKYSPDEIVSVGDNMYEYNACCSMQNDKFKVQPYFISNEAMDLIEFAKQILNCLTPLLSSS